MFWYYNANILPQRLFVCFGIIMQIFYLKGCLLPGIPYFVCYLVYRIFFRNNRSRLLDVQPLGCSGWLLDGDVMSFYLLLGSLPVVMKGYHFGQVGGKDGQGYCINLVELWGHSPPRCGQKGGSF